jgi:outer membrane cobalamin receptor
VTVHIAASLLAWFMIVGICTVVRAEDVTMAPVVVTAPRITEAEAHAPTSFTTVIDAAQHAEQVETVADALADSVGVTVRRFGGLGAFSTVSIRGSSANQVQVYLDGIPLSRARNETVNLADLPLDSLDHLEVYRGTAPVGFGTGAIGGVVNLVTKPPSVTPTTEASASYGSFTTRKLVVAHSEQVHGVDLLAYVTYLGSEGNFSFVGQNPNAGTSTTQLVPQTRVNNAFDSVDALLKAGYSIAPGLRADLTSETFFKDQGVPGIDENQSLTASLSGLRALNYLRLTSSARANVDLAATIYGVYERQTFVDPKGLIGTGQQDRVDQTSVVGGNCTGSYYPTAHQALGWFAETSHEAFVPSNDVPATPNEPDESRLHATLALQDQAGFFDDRALLVPTVRYEHVRDSMADALSVPGQPTVPAQTRDHDLFSPSLGAQIRLWPWLAVRGNIGRVERAPNFTELFGNSGSLVGNPRLRPETALNRDVGLVATASDLAWLEQLRVEYAYFNNDINDLIVFVFNHRSFASPINADARVRGHELSLQATVLHHVRVDTNFTHQNAEDRNAINHGNFLGNQLPGRPADELYTRLELFNDRGKLFYEFNYVSGNFLEEANFHPVPSRDVHSVGCSLQVLPSLTLSVEARNITDNQISDIGNFPLPGRSYFGSLRVKF